MKKLTVTLILIFSLGNIYSQTHFINLPLKLTKGFGEFDYGFFSFRWNDTSVLIKNITSRIIGVPKKLKNVKYAVIYLEPYQFIYQSYLSKVITKEKFQQLQGDLNWTPDLKRLVSQNIKCFVTVLSAMDSVGQQIFMIDKNNNNNFSDDKVLIPIEINATEKEILANLVTFKCQRFSNNKIIDDSATISIVKTKNDLRYSLAEYATTEFSISNKKYHFQICSLLFSSRSFVRSEIAIIESEKTNGKINPDSTIRDGEYLHLGNKIYQHMGIDFSRNVLKLKSVNATEYYSPKVGFYAPLFQEYSINQNVLISVDSYKGKYLFIDFWGTWCKPCIADIDYLKQGYLNLDSTKIEMLGILSFDSLQNAKEYINSSGITWNQILSDKVTALYNITEFPTNFLINPFGKIIAKNINPKTMIEDIRNIVKGEN